MRVRSTLVNFFGSPALSLDEVLRYRQDLIFGASLAASLGGGL